MNMPVKDVQKSLRRFALAAVSKCNAGWMRLVGMGQRGEDVVEVPWKTATVGRLAQYTISDGYTVRGRSKPTSPYLNTRVRYVLARWRPCQKKSTNPKQAVENVASTAVVASTLVS